MLKICRGSNIFFPIKLSSDKLKFHNQTARLSSFIHGRAKRFAQVGDDVNTEAKQFFPFDFVH